MPGAPYSDEAKRTALEVWAFEANRSASATADRLATHYAITVTDRTIQRWASDEDWHTKARELYAELSPALMERTKHNLMAAAPHASDYLLQVALGTIPADKNRTVVALAIVDRVGFQPVSRSQIQLQRFQSFDHALPSNDELASLSVDELRALAQPSSTRASDLVSPVAESAPRPPPVQRHAAP